MSPQRRTLLFIFVLISAKHGFGSSVLSDPPPTFKGGTPTAKSLFKASSPAQLIAAAQRLLPGSQRPILNEVNQHIAEPCPVRTGPACQKGSLIVEPSLPNIPCNTPIVNQVITAEIKEQDALPTTSPIITPIYPPQSEYSIPVKLNSSPFGEISLGPELQTLPLPESFYVNSFGPSSDSPQCYQSPIPRGSPTANSLFKATSPSALIAAAQRLLPGSQRPITNEVIKQPIAELCPVRAGPACQKGAVNVEPSIPNIPCNTPMVNPVISPEVKEITPFFSPSSEYFIPVQKTSLPLRETSLGPELQTLPSPESFYVNSLGPSPDPPKCYQSPIMRGTPTANSLFKANSPSELIAALQRLLLGSQRPVLNEITPPPVIAEPYPNIAGPACQIGSVNIESSIPNIPSCDPVITPEVEELEALPTTSPITIMPIHSLQSEYSIPVEQNSLPCGQITLGPELQTLSLPESLYANSFGSCPGLPQYCQSPITVKVPPMPIVSPITAYAAPTPKILPLNVPAEVSTPEYYTKSLNTVPVSYQSPIKLQEIPPVVAPIPVPLPSGFGSNNPSLSGYNSQMPLNLQITMPTPPPPVIVEPMPVLLPAAFGSNGPSLSGCNSELPLNLQITMPTPCPSEQPIIVISSPAPVAGDSSSFTQLVIPPPPPPPMVPPPPIIVSGRSKKNWKNILPILLIALSDGGCQNGGNCCSGGGNNMPIPFPIPMPTHNPVIVKRGRKKASRDKQNDAEGDRIRS